MTPDIISCKNLLKLIYSGETSSEVFLLWQSIAGSEEAFKLGRFYEPETTNFRILVNFMKSKLHS